MLIFSASVKRQKLELYVSSLRRSHADLHCALQTTDYTSRFVRELRTFGRADDGSSVAPLTKAIGGLAGGGRGGDTSEAVTAPSFHVPDPYRLFSSPALAALSSS